METNSHTESITWPCTYSGFTLAQQDRVDEFRSDLARARAAHQDGFSYHIWVNGRYYDSAVTHTDAFEQCRSMRAAGERSSMLIGSGGTDRTLTVSATGMVLRIDLP